MKARPEMATGRMRARCQEFVENDLRSYFLVSAFIGAGDVVVAFASVLALVSVVALASVLALASLLSILVAVILYLIMTRSPLMSAGAFVFLSRAISQFSLPF